MERIKITNINKESDSFSIPWEWLSIDSFEPVMEDIEASSERGITTGLLNRVITASVPSLNLNINKKLTQLDIKDLLRLINMKEVYITYFEKYKDDYVTYKVYVDKPSLVIYEIPEDDDTNKIIYNEFTLNFHGIEGVKYE